MAAAATAAAAAREKLGHRAVRRKKNNVFDATPYHGWETPVEPRTRKWVIHGKNVVNAYPDTSIDEIGRIFSKFSLRFFQRVVGLEGLNGVEI